MQGHSSAPGHAFPAAPVDLQPPLEGDTLRLRPLSRGDFDALHAAASDPALWALHPEPTRWRRDVFERFFDGGLASGGALVVVERAGGAVGGSSRYYAWQPDARDITLGYTFLVRRLWGGRSNRELKGLMLDHAFGFAERAWFDVGVGNLRSRRAMEKLGGVLARETPADPATGTVARVHYRIDRSAWAGARVAADRG